MKRTEKEIRDSIRTELEWVFGAGDEIPPRNEREIGKVSEVVKKGKLVLNLMFPEPRQEFRITVEEVT